jgi:tetratricopeptide (TPR) repeat protein
MQSFFLKVTGFFLCCLVFSGCALTLPKEEVLLSQTKKCPEWTPAQLEKDARLFDHNTDTFTLQCALDHLRNAETSPIRQTSTGSHICFLLADRTDTDQVRRERFASEGVNWAEIALAESGEEDGDVYYYLAVNLGIAVKEHMALALKNLDRLVSGLEKALELSPDVNYGGPYRVLGMLYLMAPPWPQGIGDGDRALELLDEAIKRHPEHPKNHIFYAQALWEMEGEDSKKETRKHLEKGRRLMHLEQWKSVKDRWMKDLNQVAREAHLKLRQETPTGVGAE